MAYPTSTGTDKPKRVTPQNIFDLVGGTAEGDRVVSDRAQPPRRPAQAPRSERALLAAQIPQSHPASWHACLRRLRDAAAWDRLRTRGGRVVQVDHKKTPTATKAAERF